MPSLRALFGPSREEIWRQLSAEIDGRYLPAGYVKGDKVQATHGEWTVTLDTYVVSSGKTHITCTRMRAPYVNPGGFRFTIYRKNMFSEIGKWFGLQDILVDDERFDRDFIIKATDQARVRQLFSNPKIRELIASQPSIHLSVRDDEGWFGAKFPAGVDELLFAVHGEIKDVERLKRLYELFAETLDQLCRIGLAEERAPGVTI